MKTLKQLERLQKVHKFIKQKKTGTPGEFAHILGISRRQLHYIIDYLKELEAPLEYNRKIPTFYYSYDFDLLVNIKVQVIVNDELRTIYAGNTLLQENFLSARLLHGTDLS
ncbi:MAG TPA: hypothetical protein ENK46_02090 [Flavobacteriia bacterium]|nr:hypothetical protein [Flavobacteriia bacterium]